MVTVGSILGGTFRFVRGNVRAILVWSGVLFLLNLVVIAMLQPLYAAQVAALQTDAPSAAGMGWIWLTIPLSLFAFVMLWAAVFRAVLLPQESRFAYMRLGMDELRLLGCLLILIVGFYLILAIGGVIAVIIGVAAGASAAPFLIVAGLILAVALFAWLGTRLSLAGPLTIRERKIILGPAWRLTGGKFWPLLGAYAAIVLLIVLTYGGITLVRSGPALAAMMHPADPAARLQIETMNAANYSLSLISVVAAVATSLIGALAIALQAGVVAVAAEQLTGRGGQLHLSEVFE